MTSQDGQMNPSQNQNTIMHGKLKIIHTGSYKLLEWYLDCLYLFIFNLVLRQRLGLQLCWTRHFKETIIYEQAVFKHTSFCWIQITNSAFLITFGFYFLQTTDFVLISELWQSLLHSQELKLSRLIQKFPTFTLSDL